jgi:hypothetical protein
LRGARLLVGKRKALNHLNKLVEGKYLNKEEKRKLLGLYKKTRVSCSCWMCGNPRKIFGNGKLAKTFRETKQEITAEEELNLIGEN